LVLHIKTMEGLTMSKTFEKQAITAEFAQKLVDAAVAKANELKVPQRVAVVDDGGNLKVFRAHGRRGAHSDRDRAEQGLHRAASTFSEMAPIA
jgi:uncharacterized protein GlcG (DUF336 family)